MKNNYIFPKKDSMTWLHFYNVSDLIEYRYSAYALNVTIYCYD